MPSTSIFLTADTHFGHRLMATERGFEDSHAHDQVLIDNWNSVVSTRDTVYHLGDFAFANKARIREVAAQLKGTVIHVLGNHDRRLKALYSEMWDCSWYRFVSSPQKMALSHFPFEVWERKHYGVPHFHGHSHGRLQSPGLRRLDVGVDCHGLTPVELGHALSLLPSAEEAVGATRG